MVDFLGSKAASCVEFPDTSQILQEEDKGIEKKKQIGKEEERIIRQC